MAGVNISKLEYLIASLQSQLESRNEQIRVLEEHISKASKDTQKMIDVCRDFCMQILEMEIADGTLTSSELKTLSLKELTDRAKEEYEKRQAKNQKLFDVFAEKLQNKNETISGLQAQVSQLQIRLAQNVATVGDDNLPEPTVESPDLERATVYFSESKNEDVGSVQPGISKNNDVSQNSESVADFAQSIVTETSKVNVASTSSSKKPMMVNYENYKSQMTPLMWLIIDLMGGEGLCEFPEIKKRCFEESEDKTIKQSTVNTALTALKNIGAINKGLKINTGIRWFYVYELEDLGYRMYVEKHGNPPVESEIKKLIREHDNVKHGYYIKEANSILKEKFDYKTISTSRKANYIKLQNGKASIPDIICTTDSYVDYYEVECGNHPQAEFNDKCNKLKMITQNIRYVVPDNDTLNKKLIPQIKDWIKASGGPNVLRKANVKVYITTLKKLSDKEWSVVFDMKSDEPTLLKEVDNNG